MYYFKTSKEILDFLNKTNKSIGLVPTMGALHAGHESLIKKALIENEIVIVSIFVNPTQFDNKDDLINYPRNLESDVKKIKKLDSKIIIYSPLIKDLYVDNIIVKDFNFGFIGNELEGHFRKNHFNSVATIVEKLFNLFKPNRAYFGEKDYQQILIIRNLILKSNLNVQLTSCPTVRDPDGLALSSRNNLLSKKERKIAPVLYKTLLNVKNKIKNEQIESVILKIKNEFKLIPSLKLEYLEIREALSLKPVKKINKEKKYRAFISARIGKIRLIDNIEL
tara:strand:- start:364 stop:1200 length:837 start_codon:yes stop_codon:yes gene_type:complete